MSPKKKKKRNITIKKILDHENTSAAKIINIQ